MKLLEKRGIPINNKYLIEDLRDFREWAESNIYEVPIELPDVLSRAADVIENMEKHIEVLQKEVEKTRRRNEYLEDAMVTLIGKAE